MKHLLSAIAVAALVGAVPAWAQTSSSDHSKQPMPQASSSGTADSSAMGTSSDTAKSGTSIGKAHHRAAARGGRSHEDNMAEELNRQELDRVNRNDAATSSGSTTQPSGMGGTSAPAAAPNTPHTGVEAGGKESGSPSPAQTQERSGASSKD
jgi:hypothetical protein